MSDEARKRWQRARIAGGRQLDGAAWRALVDRAIETTKRYHRSLRAQFLSDAAPIRDWNYEVCPPRCFPISAQLVLDIETHMAETEMLATDLEELGARTDLDDALRAKLQRTLEAARAVLRQRIEQDRRSHLAVIDGGDR